MVNAEIQRLIDEEKSLRMKLTVILRSGAICLSMQGVC